MRATTAPAGEIRPSESGSSDVLKWVISAFIVFTLASQFVIGFTYRGGQSFPILAYPMFSRAHYAGERLNDFVVYATADGGAEEAFDPETIEISQELYAKAVSNPIIKGVRREIAVQLANRACEKHDAKVVTLNVYDSGYYIDRDGPVSVGRKLMGSMDFQCPGA